MSKKKICRIPRQNETLCHWGVIGQKWGILRYQNPDGSLTPLGREHYGVGPPRNPNETGAEKIKRWGKAALDTAAVQGYIKYNKTEKVIKGDRFAKAKATRQQKADEKRAEEAYKKRQEEKAKAKEEKAKAKEEAAKEEEELRKEKVKNVAKSKEWEDYTDEELEAYIKRVGLESRATEAKLLKVDSTRKKLAEIASYGQTGLELYKTYNQVIGMVKNQHQQKVPKISEQLAKEYLKQVYKDAGENFDVSKLDDKELQNALSIIGKIRKLENGGKDNQDNQNQQKKKGN